MMNNSNSDITDSAVRPYRTVYGPYRTVWADRRRPYGTDTRRRAPYRRRTVRPYPYTVRCRSLGPYASVSVYYPLYWRGGGHCWSSQDRPKDSTIRFLLS